MKKIAVALGLFFLGRLISSKMSFIRALDFSIASVDYSGGLARPKLTVTVLISNPTTESLTIKRITGKCYVNGMFVGNAESTGELVLQTGNNKLKMTGSPNINTIPALVNIMNTKAGIFSFEGYVHILNFELPISFDYKFI